MKIGDKVRVVLEGIVVDIDSIDSIKCYIGALEEAAWLDPTEYEVVEDDEAARPNSSGGRTNKR